MPLIDAARYLIEQGFGRSMKSFYALGAYSDALARERALPALLKEGSHERLAYDAGYTDFGMRMQVTSERNALDWARRNGGSAAHDPRERALIRTLGQQLLSEMRKRVLPKQTRELAWTFRSADADLQLAILEWIYHGFAGVSGELPVSVRQFDPSSVRRSLEYDYRPEQVLPKALGSLEDPGEHPNCVGLACILAAFCQATGAPMLLVSTVETGSYRSWIDFGRLLRRVKKSIMWLWRKDYVETNRFDAVNHAVTTDLDIADAMQDWAMDFHFSVAVKIRDDRWIHIDPYMENFSVLPDAMGLDAAYRKLHKYDAALPGLHLTLEADAWRDEVFAPVLEDADRLHEAMQRLDQELQEFPAGLLGFEATRPDKTRRRAIAGTAYDAPELREAFVEGMDDDTEFTEDELESAFEEYREELLAFDSYFGDDEIIENTEGQRSDGFFDPFAYRLCNDPDYEELLAEYWVYQLTDDSPALDVLVDVRTQRREEDEEVFWTHATDSPRLGIVNGLLEGEVIANLANQLLALALSESGEKEDAIDLLVNSTEAFLFDPDYRRERISDMHTEFVTEALVNPERMKSALMQGLKKSPPGAIEVMLPEFGAALAVLNYIRCWTDIEVAGTTFLRHSASQMYWHEAAELENDGTAEGSDDANLLERTEAFVRRITHQYPTVRWKLEALTRKRRKAHGKEEAEQR